VCVLSFDLCLVDFSCDFANGFLRFVVFNDLLSFLYITNLGRLFRFPETLSLKEVLIFSCMDRRAELRFELLWLTKVRIWIWVLLILVGKIIVEKHY